MERPASTPAPSHASSTCCSTSAMTRSPEISPRPAGGCASNSTRPARVTREPHTGSGPRRIHLLGSGWFSLSWNTHSASRDNEEWEDEWCAAGGGAARGDAMEEPPSSSTTRTCTPCATRTVM